MTKDDRLYAKFTLDFPDHPKILCLSTEAKWALVDLTIYSRRHLTDGFIPKAVALAKHGADVCLELATNDAANPSLIESENGYQIHDFALHQSTKAEIEALTEKRRRAGQKGGQARAQANAKQVLKQTASKSKPETETETRTTTHASHLLVAGDEQAKSNPTYHRPPTAEPRCPHGQTGPCGECADQATHDVDHRHGAIARRQEEQAALAELTRREIDDCPMCDDRGYRGSRVCSHDPDEDDRRQRGIAEIQAELDKKRGVA